MTIDELFEQTSPEPNTGCWLWVGTYRGEYGAVRIPGARPNQQCAHRVAFEAAVEPIKPGWVVDHLCGEKLCINPAHLEQVTHGVNISRGQPQGDLGRGRFAALRPTKAGTRTILQPIRLSEREKAILEEAALQSAALQSGAGLSSWLRHLGMREARRMGLSTHHETDGDP